MKFCGEEYNVTMSSPLQRMHCLSACGECDWCRIKVGAAPLTGFKFGLTIHQS